MSRMANRDYLTQVEGGITSLGEVASLLVPGTVHVWHTHLPSWTWDDDASLLSPAELGWAGQLKTRALRRTYIRCHSALRRMLAAYTGQPAQTQVFETERYGRPRLTSVNIDFNLSHSDDWMGLAVVEGCHIGIDIEVWRGLTDTEALIERYFFTHKRALYLAEAASRRTATFARLWTRKEATLKALGCGLIEGLEELDAVNEPVLRLSLARLRKRGLLPLRVVAGAPNLWGLSSPQGYSSTLVCLNASASTTVSSYLWRGETIQRWCGAPL